MATPSSSDPAGLTPDQLRIVDGARQRLDQLTKSIESVLLAVHHGRPMPDLTALQAHSKILTETTSSITSHVANNADLLSTLVAYPSTNYPGRTQEHLVGHLVRKKNEPGVDAWVDEGRAEGMEVMEKGKGEELEDDWRFAGGWTLREAHRITEVSRARGQALQMGKQDWMEKVEEEDSEDEEDDGDVEMDMTVQEEVDAGKSIALLARFATTGVPS